MKELLIVDNYTFVILLTVYIMLSLFSFSFFFQYTINSKKVEVAVKKIISGGDIKQRGALANPSSLDLYYNIPELALPNN